MYNLVLNKNTKNNGIIKFTFKFNVHVNYVVIEIDFQVLPTGYFIN